MSSSMNVPYRLWLAISTSHDKWDETSIKQPNLYIPNLNCDVISLGRMHGSSTSCISKYNYLHISQKWSCIFFKKKDFKKLEPLLLYYHIQSSTILDSPLNVLINEIRGHRCFFPPHSCSCSMRPYACILCWLIYLSFNILKFNTSNFILLAKWTSFSLFQLVYLTFKNFICF